MVSGNPLLHSIWVNDQVYVQVTLPLAPKRKFFSVQRSPIPKERCFLDGSNVLPACPSDSSSIRMKMSREHWWNDTDRGKSKYWETNPSRCHFVHHKPHVVWPGVEAGPPW